MAEAIVSLLLDRFDEVLLEQAKNEMNLVKGAHSKIDNIIYQLKLIRPDLNNAEDRRQNDETDVKKWLDEFEDTLYEMEDVVDDWNTVILFKRIEQDAYSDNKSKLWLAPSSMWKRIVLRRSRCIIERKIKKMEKILDSLVKKKDRFSFELTESRPFRPHEEDLEIQSPFSGLSSIYGQDDPKRYLMEMILKEEETADHIKFIFILGMGGIGKTTLAQLLYHDSVVVDNFDARAWVCVGPRISEIRILREILRSMNLYSSSSHKNESSDSLRALIRSSISQKRFLLVVDDLYEWAAFDDVIRHLLYGTSQCTVLVTTRDEHVARQMGYIHRPQVLSFDESWELIRNIAFPRDGSQKYEEIGRKVVFQIGGLPLIIRCIGGMLRSKKSVEEWESVKQKLRATYSVVEMLTTCYQDLPTTLKRCFSYCLIFPVDVIEIDADKLVRMWLAHGYLGSTGNDDRVEERGHEYVMELANRYFFHGLETDDNGKIKSFSIHNLIRELARYYHYLQFRTEDFDTINPQIPCRHLTILPSTETQLRPLSLPANVARRLRTLFAPETGQEEFQTNHFPQLSYLRVLSFSDGNLRMLPKEIGKLIYLRYLDLSGNPLEELPEFICRLCNLETLDLEDCVLFKKLPSGIGKLIMMRHLLTRNTPRFLFFPEGLEKLTMLRTLGRFMVGKEFNKMKYLKNLNNLEGTLEIDFYELNDEDVVSDAEAAVSDAEAVLSDAEQASLKDKRYLRELKLTFNAEISSEVFEALEAPPNLQRLYIYGLRVNSWSNWISAPQNHLKELKINFCTKCPSLPPLWRLPSLEILDIDAMMAMTSVSLLEFLGIRSPSDRNTIECIESGTEVAPLGMTDNSIQIARSDTEEGSSYTNRSIEVAHSDTEESKDVAHSDTEESKDVAHSDTEESKDVAHSGTTAGPSGTEVVPSSPPSSSHRVAFPMLKKLRFNFCIEWDNWEDIPEQGEIEENNVSILPSLLELEVSRCEMLTSLPHELLRRISTLRSLKIGYCHLLSKLYKDNEQRARLPMNITTIVPSLVRVVAGEQDSEVDA